MQSRGSAADFHVQESRLPFPGSHTSPGRALWFFFQPAPADSPLPGTPLEPKPPEERPATMGGGTGRGLRETGGYLPDRPTPSRKPRWPENPIFPYTNFGPIGDIELLSQGRSCSGPYNRRTRSLPLSGITPATVASGRVVAFLDAFMLRGAARTRGGVGRTHRTPTCGVVPDRRRTAG
jgi:hypothetical protein